MILKFSDIGNIPDMIAKAIFLLVVNLHLLSAQSFTLADCLFHRAVAVTTAADIVNLSRAGILVKMIKGIDQIIRVNIIPDLLPLVTEYIVFPTTESALHKISEKAMQLGTGMSRSGQTTTPKTDCIHPKVAAILLHQDIGSHF